MSRQDQRAQEPTKQKKGNWSTLFLLIIIGLALTVFRQPLYDLYSLTASSASNDIRAIAQDSGLNTHGQAVFLRANPEFVNADKLAEVCPHDMDAIELGCFIASSNKIYLLHIEIAELKPVEISTVVHEALHAAWSTLPAKTIRSLGSELNSYYEQGLSTTLSESAKPYHKKDADVFTNELHSLIGSEVSLSEMPDPLQVHFTQYFSDQSKTVQAHKAFSENIDRAIAAIKEHEQQLDEKSAELARFKQQYVEPAEQNVRRSAQEGDAEAYNKNLETFNHNRDTYNNMVNDYNRDLEAYNAKRQSFVDAYATLYPNETLPVPGSREL